MGIEHRGAIAAQLIEGGLDAATPVAVVEQAWTGQQRTTRADEELGPLTFALPRSSWWEASLVSTFDPSSSSSRVALTLLPLAFKLDGAHVW